MLTLAELLSRAGRKRLAVAANCSTAELAAVLDGLPDDPPENLAAKAVEARASIDAAIADAVSEVGSAVAGRYDVARVSPAPMLKRLAADRALFHLHADVVPEDLEQRFEKSLAALESLRDGTRLIADPAGAPYPLLGGVIGVHSPDPVFDEKSLAGYTDPCLDRDIGAGAC